MDLSRLLGETTDYDKKLFLEEKDKQELEVQFCKTNEYKGTLQAVIHGEEIESV